MPKPIATETYSTRYSRASRRPAALAALPVFYRCNVCGQVVIRALKVGCSECTGAVVCCGQKCQQLAPLPAASVNGAPSVDALGREGVVVPHAVDYHVFGGFDHSALQVKINNGLPLDANLGCIEWVYLQAFQGGQLKYIAPSARPVCTFAFGDEDAYGYCDRAVCRMGHELCQFECKRGMHIYAYCSCHGLAKVPLLGKKTR